MGGTFDPIHIGHLMMAEQARDQMGLDQVWFIPAGNPPHKQGKRITDAIHRLQMVRCATAGNDTFHVSEWEVERKGPSYTVTTMKAFQNLYPDWEFFLILGSDMVNSLPSWYAVEELLQIVQVIALGRPGYEKEELPDWIQQRVHWVEDARKIDISSSKIRAMIAENRSIRYFVPDAVMQYIEEKCLYGTGEDHSGSQR